jgi:hypothetical protein
MRLKLFVVLIVVLGYLGLLFACNKATPNTARTAALTSGSNAASAVPDGTDPPHAVDTSGKAIPGASATQPDKPIILAKDSDDPKNGELKPEAAFDHVKHSTLPQYSIDGKGVLGCVECHHTDQAAAPAGQEYLKKFERKETLTAKQLETSKDNVKSCRACHFQASADETDDYPPKSVTYPAALNKPPSGKLTNDVAYHLNCNTCHDAAKKRDPKLNAPQTCTDCHKQKS